MADTAPVRFGVFEVDLGARELRKRGVRIRLADQPFQVLEVLLERRGGIVTRQELQRRLWPADTFVDFDLSLNSAIRKLRDALGDSAERPGYIETVPRRGYRFIMPVEEASSGNGAASIEPPAAHPARSRASIVVWAALGLLAATTVGVVLSQAARSGTSSPNGAPEVNPDAYAFFLKGVDAAGRVNYDGFLAAASYFEQAVALQPDYAPAFERLAHARLQHIWTGPMAPRDVLPQVEDAALRAIALDDTLVEAHRILAITRRLAGDHARADAETRRALDLAPIRDSLGLKAAALVRAGEFDQAAAAAEQASKLDPRSVDRKLLLAVTYRAAGRLPSAIAALQGALGLEPGRSNVLFQLGATYVLAGDLEEGIETLEQAVSRSGNGGNGRFRAYLAFAYARDGRLDEARKLLGELLVEQETQYVSSFGIALVHDALGDREAARAALDRAASECAVEFTQLDLYPPFPTLVSHPRYSESMRKAGAGSPR